MENKTTPNESAQASPGCSGWLNRLFQTFGKPSTPEAVAAYVIALADLNEAHLKLAFEETFRSHRSSFIPTPGEIRGYLERALENAPPRKPGARRDCPKCGGTGFVVEDIPGQTYAGGTPYRQARRCPCLPPK